MAYPVSAMTTSNKQHGTAIAFGSLGVLIRGAPGSGKSDLALRLLALEPGGLASLVGTVTPPAALIADDQVIVTPQGGSLVLSAPANLRGLIEIRGVGIIPVQRVSPGARLALVVDAATTVQPAPRLPERHATTQVSDQRILQLVIDLRAPSAPLAVLLAVAGFLGATPDQK
jgi:serine kinase of HPr protein (carbohydrate metabolism regulator)